MNDKKYGVELTANIDSFKRKLLEAKNITNDVSEVIKNKIKDPMEMAGDTSKKSFEQRIATIGELSGKYGELVLQYLNVVSLEGKQSENAKKLKEDMSNLTKQIEKEGDALGEVAEALDDLGEEEEEQQKSGFNLIAIFQNFEKSLMKGVNSIKRFSLSILGVQSIYSMLSKATHAYMAQDDALTNQMQANWIALGAILEPIIIRLINLFTKLVGYVNVFVKAITGGKVDIIAKAMDAVNKKTNKAKNAVGALNKELSTFDEITNLSFDTGTGLGDTSGLDDAFNNMNNMELNPNIVKVINDFADAIKRVWDWVSKLTWIWDIIKQKIELWKRELEGVWKIIHGLFTGNADEAKEGIDILFKAIKEEIESNQDVWTTITDKLVTAMKTALQIIFELIKEWINNKIRELFEGKFNEIGIKIGKIIGNQIIAFINSGLLLIESAINGFFSSINLAIKAINIIPGVEIQEIRKIVIPKIPALAKGNVAYEPTVAEFGEYSGANSNPEITAPQNVMRETLFEALTDALPLIGSTTNQDNREIVLNVNGREFARATYGDYQTEAKRVGSSNVAIRRG